MDRKKTLFIICGITFVLLTIILVIFLRFRFTSQNISTASSIQPTPIVEELATWIDQSGFTFKYPKSLKLNPHEEDQENYAHVELVSPTHAGNLIVWTKDTSTEDINGWLKQKKIQNAIESQLGGEKAMKVLENGDFKKLITSTIYNGYLYQIEANLKEEDYWNNIFNLVNSSFKFVQPTDSPDEKMQGAQDYSDQNLGEDISDEGEEVIE